MPSRIYLASPYSTPMNPRWNEGQKKVVRGMRYHETMEAAVYLINKGYVVYSPIMHWHAAAKRHNLPKGYEFWQRMDENFIKWADALFVLKLKGWDKSDGVAKEILLAKQLGRTIGYVTPKEVKYYVRVEDQDVP